LTWTLPDLDALAHHPLRVDIHHDALPAETPGRPLDEPGVLDRRRVDRDLVRPRVEQRPDVVQRPDPAADGDRHEAHLRRPPDHVQDDPAPLVTGRDVEEDQLVRPLQLVTGGDLDRVAGVAEVDEVGPLDHSALVHVKARNDPLGQHDAKGAPIGPSSRRGRAAPSPTPEL